MATKRIGVLVGAGTLLACLLVAGFLATRTSDRTLPVEAPPLLVVHPPPDAAVAVPVASVPIDAAPDAAVIDAGAKRGVGVGAVPGALRKASGRLTLALVDGVAIVNLAGGPPTVKPYGPPTPRESRPISGRVIDRDGNGVGGAIVLVDRAIDVHAGNLLATAGTVTDATGAFGIDHAPVGGVAIALAGDDWSDVVALADTTTLHVLGHGGLTGKLTYAGHGDSFKVTLRLRDARFTVHDETPPDGELAIASLPPGIYTLTTGLAQTFGGGASATVDREITIWAGGTTNVELALNAGTTIALTSQPPDGVTPQGIVYWLFTGAPPKTGAEARTRAAAEHPQQMTRGGGGNGEPLELHDVAAGSYAACAAAFDARAMAALNSPFGCVAITVHDDDSVLERRIDLVNL